MAPLNSVICEDLQVTIFLKIIPYMVDQHMLFTLASKCEQSPELLPNGLNLYIIKLVFVW